MSAASGPLPAGFPRGVEQPNCLLCGGRLNDAGVGYYCSTCNVTFYDVPTVGCWSRDQFAAEVGRLTAEVERLKLAMTGEEKARHLLLAGMESLSESRDELKHRCRELEAKNARVCASSDPPAPI